MNDANIAGEGLCFDSDILLAQVQPQGLSPSAPPPIEVTYGAMSVGHPHFRHWVPNERGNEKYIPFISYRRGVPHFGHANCIRHRANPINVKLIGNMNKAFFVRAASAAKATNADKKTLQALINNCLADFFIRCRSLSYRRFCGKYLVRPSETTGNQ